MKQYWARHQGLRRWGVRTPVETAEDVHKTEMGVLFVWADVVELVGGALVFRSQSGELQGGFAPESWQAFFEAAVDADTAQAIETE